MKQILYLGEGVRDVGRQDATVQGDFEGDLPRLVRRLCQLEGLPERFGYGHLTFREVVSRFSRAGRPTRLGGKSKELRDAVLASLDSERIVVALIDVRLEELEQMRADVVEILRACTERYEEPSVVIGLAVQEIEIWMLVDPESRKAALGTRKAAEAVPADPETHGDPKSLWSSLCNRCPTPSGVDRKVFEDTQRAKAWEALRPAIVAGACPRGFAPFAEQMTRTLNRETRQK